MAHSDSEWATALYLKDTVNVGQDAGAESRTIRTRLTSIGPLELEGHIDNGAAKDLALGEQLIAICHILERVMG